MTAFSPCFVSILERDFQLCAFLIVFDRANESAPVDCVVVPFNANPLMREATSVSVRNQPAGGTERMPVGHGTMGEEARQVTF